MSGWERVTLREYSNWTRVFDHLEENASGFGRAAHLAKECNASATYAFGGL